MRTDYNASGFAQRYGRARALPASTLTLWSGTLAAAIPASDVEIVLDAGAGVGRFWPAIFAAWHPTAILGMDTSEAMLRLAPLMPCVRVVVGEVDAVPLPSEHVDVAFCSMTLQYSDSPAMAVRELTRVVRPDGWLCVRSGTTTTLESFDFLPFFATAREAEYAAMPTLAEVESWLLGAGLTLEKIETVSTAPRSRIEAFRAVFLRGFPSLQLVPRRELYIGLTRYALWLSLGAIRGRPLQGESSVLLVARRT